MSPLPYLHNCHYDVCSCADGKDCLCNAVANYAAACARKGVHVAWREPSFCGGCAPCLPPAPGNPTDVLRLCALALCLALSAHSCVLTSVGCGNSSFTATFPSHLPARHDSRVWFAHRTVSPFLPVSGGQVGLLTWRSRTLVSLPSRYFLCLLPPSVSHLYGGTVE